MSQTVVWGIGAAITVAVAGLAQTAGTIEPRFEVASIKPCSPDVPPGGRSGAGIFARELLPERLTLNCSDVKGIIHTAFVLFAHEHIDQLTSVPIEGGPSWINSELYKIEAKATDPQRQETLHGPMLRALLEDRLKLKLHRESREIPVYSLVVAKGGAKMPRFQEGTCVVVDLMGFLSRFPPGSLPDVAPGQRRCQDKDVINGPNVKLDYEAWSIEELCRLTLRGMDRPVVDNTGLSGRFHIRLEYLPDETSSSTVRAGGSLSEGPSDIAPGTSIFTALQQQLGLKLESAKGTGEVIVIDSVERPSEN